MKAQRVMTDLKILKRKPLRIDYESGIKWTKKIIRQALDKQNTKLVMQGKRMSLQEKNTELKEDLQRDKENIIDMQILKETFG